jgi:hypothetical protein
MRPVVKAVHTVTIGDNHYLCAPAIEPKDEIKSSSQVTAIQL